MSQFILIEILLSLTKAKRFIAEQEKENKNCSRALLTREDREEDSVVEDSDSHRSYDWFTISKVFLEVLAYSYSIGIQQLTSTPISIYAINMNM